MYCPREGFTRRLYAHGRGLTKPHQHVRFKEEMRLDVEIWREFLCHPSVYCRPFIDFSKTLKANEIDFYMDASGCIGYRGVSGTPFMLGLWDQDFLKFLKQTLPLHI